MEEHGQVEGFDVESMIPDHIIERILSYLIFAFRVQCEQVCRRWQLIGQVVSGKITHLNSAQLGFFQMPQYCLGQKAYHIWKIVGMRINAAQIKHLCLKGCPELEVPYQGLSWLLANLAAQSVIHLQDLTILVSREHVRKKRGTKCVPIELPASVQMLVFIRCRPVYTTLNVQFELVLRSPAELPSLQVLYVEQCLCAVCGNSGLYCGFCNVENRLFWESVIQLFEKSRQLEELHCRRGWKVATSFLMMLCIYPLYFPNLRIVDVAQIWELTNMIWNDVLESRAKVAGHCRHLLHIWLKSTQYNQTTLQENVRNFEALKVKIYSDAEVDARHPSAESEGIWG